MTACLRLAEILWRVLEAYRVENYEPFLAIRCPIPSAQSQVPGTVCIDGTNVGGFNPFATYDLVIDKAVGNGSVGFVLPTQRIATR